LQDEFYIRKCIRLARRGEGFVSPNPLVGAVLVRDDKIVGRGYHKRFGGAHAEVNAVRDAGGECAGATLYVNLEPCCYFGKTPPCTDLILSKGIKRVVIGAIDPNPLVAGKGIRMLVEAGLDVVVGVLENECVDLNEFFFKLVSTGLPFVSLKIAQSLDGKIATETGDSKWITSEKSRVMVHKLRSQYDAVLVGAGTVKADNPDLTVRLVKGRNPYRVVLDNNLTLPLNSSVLTDDSIHQTIVFADRKVEQVKPRKIRELKSRGVSLVLLNGSRGGLLSLRGVLKKLGSMGIGSVLVEGGSRVFSSFLKERLADKLLVFTAPKIIGDGIPWLNGFGVKSVKDALAFSRFRFENIENDVLFEGYLRKKRLR
jgi:diaminohydroxyphosphoribosylaminopyrimidine deaminase/5-amino-6-(5-phosphoribosylamino)uracil reductase